MQTDARRRIEIENTAPLATDTQMNAPKAAVDKNCNATAVDQVQGELQTKQIQLVFVTFVY